MDGFGYSLLRPNSDCSAISEKLFSFLQQRDPSAVNSAAAFDGAHNKPTFDPAPLGLSVLVGGDVVGEAAGRNCIKIGLPGKLILSERKGLLEVLFS